MRFPLRLTADVALSLVARAMRVNKTPALVLQVAPDGKFYASFGAADSNGQPANGRIAEFNANSARQCESPIIWLGGCEPLEHAAVPRMTSDLTRAGRHVFLQTNGVLLRRRIHEFQPSSRLHLTIPFHGLEESHDLLTGRPGAYHIAMEAIRAARLSGFLICAQIVLHPGSPPGELAQLHHDLRNAHVDGMLVSPAELTTDMQRRVTKARSQFLSRRWTLVSRLLDSVALRAPIRNHSEVARKDFLESAAADCEESAQA
jgi:molybdenum cofactor biosynthesis enzyme MoaA